MPDDKRNDDHSLFHKSISVLSGLPWFEVLEKGWQLARQALQARSYRGMYEVLEHETTLELKDRAGKSATFEEEKPFRYRQDSILPTATTRPRAMELTPIGSRCKILI